MYLLYMLPYNFLTGFFGFGGSIIAILIVLQGLLRFSFFAVLIFSRDWKRLKEEWTEGSSVVLEKLRNLKNSIANWFDKFFG